MPKVEVTHPGKVLFPKTHITKQDVIDYYEFVSKWMIPLIKDHPIVMERFPEGIDHEGFFQKNVQSYFPDWIETIVVKRKEGGKGELVNSKNENTLLYLANLDALTLHIWGSSKDHLEMPDRLVFDLDPPQGKFDLARKGAYLLRDILEKDYGLKAFVMTTGSRGLHVIVPLKPKHTFDEVRDFAKEVACLVEEKDPKSFTAQMRKSSRGDRLYIDVMRNSYAQHAVAPLAIRPIEGAPIAMPVSWGSLGRVEAQTFTMKNVRHSLKNFPWVKFNTSARQLPS